MRTWFRFLQSHPLWGLPVALLFIFSLSEVISHMNYMILHDQELLPVAVQPVEFIRRLYQTGPTPRSNALLTLATTASDQEENFRLHSVVLRNWANLAAFGIHPVLYSTFHDDSLPREAKSLGWDVLPLTRTNHFGLAYIKDLFEDSTRKYTAHYQCLSHADLLFDDSLATTLLFLQQQPGMNRAIITGRRVEVPVDISNPPPLHDMKFVKLLYQRTQDHASNAYNVDYIIASRDSFPWQLLEGGVFGRAGLGAHLLQKARQLGLATVDASETIRAVHLKKVHRAKRSNQSQRTIKDSLFNHFTLGSWKAESGRVDSTEFYTAFVGNSSIVLKKRDLHTTQFQAIS